MFEQIKIVLINTTHPGNIGAVARAMKNMGYSHLSLVAPLKFPSEEAFARAAGAEDILEQATITETLNEALSDCHWILGCSARSRTVSWPVLTARTAAIETVRRYKEKSTLNTALLFGREQSGLTNEELAQCHAQVVIPANPVYPSLNLAQAVQILTYEYRMVILEQEGSFPVCQNPEAEELATATEMACFYQRLEETLIKLQFLLPEQPGHLMLYLRRLYGKSQVTKVELNILHGILTAIQKSV